jgi:hypothetical protein
MEGSSCGRDCTRVSESEELICLFVHQKMSVEDEPERGVGWLMHLIAR